jgi:hypothetical protein
MGIILLNKKLKAAGKRCCSKCGFIFPIEDFYEGRSTCRVCRDEWRAAYRQKKKRQNRRKCANCNYLGIQRGHSGSCTYHRCKVKKKMVSNKDNACRKFMEKACYDYVAYVYDYDF